MSELVRTPVLPSVTIVPVTLPAPTARSTLYVMESALNAVGAPMAANSNSTRLNHNDFRVFEIPSRRFEQHPGARLWPITMLKRNDFPHRVLQILQIDATVSQCIAGFGGGWPAPTSSFENPEGAPSKLRLGGPVDVAIPRSTPKIPHLFSSQTPSEHHHGPPTARRRQWSRPVAGSRCARLTKTHLKPAPAPLAGAL
jgi:hypothetical protein